MASLDDEQNILKNPTSECSRTRLSRREGLSSSHTGNPSFQPSRESRIRCSLATRRGEWKYQRKRMGDTSGVLVDSHC